MSQFLLQNKITGRYLVKVSPERAITTTNPREARTYPTERYAEVAATLIPNTTTSNWLAVPEREGVR